MALCVNLVISPEFHMFLGMGIGSLMGMIMMMVLMVLLMPFFGAFEVMIPLYLNGMLVGMSAGMLSTLPSIPGYNIVAGGAFAGLTVSIFIYFSNKHLTKI